MAIPETEVLRLLHLAEAIVKSRSGIAAVEHTGECLAAAILSFDPSRGETLERWVKFKVPLMVIQRIRDLDGRKGTGRYRFNKSVSHPEEMESAADHAPELDGEELQEAIRTAGKIRGYGRWIVLGRMLGGFNDRELSHIIGVTSGHVANKLTEIRESIQSDRRHDAVRCST